MAERADWTEEATKALLMFWKGEKDSCTYDKMSEHLKTLGYQFTWQNCQDKVTEITHGYLKAVETAGTINKQACPYFSDLEALFNPTSSPGPAPALIYVDQQEKKTECENEHEDNLKDDVVFASANGASNVSADNFQLLTMPYVGSCVNSEPPALIDTTLTDHQDTPTPPPPSAEGSSDCEEPRKEPESRRKRKSLETVEELQKEAEDREDARQQRQLEHEKWMEERRQQWEEKMREKDKEAKREQQEREDARRDREQRMQQYWENQRRDRELQLHQQMLMILLEHMRLGSAGAAGPFVNRR